MIPAFCYDLQNARYLSLSIHIAISKVIFYRQKMRNQNKLRLSGCPIAFGLDTFGDRWSLLIIREIMIIGHTTYSDFMDIDEKIATNILINRLKHLQLEGIITKERDPDNRRSFIYRLTKKGRDLAPVIIEIIIWSGLHDHRDFALRDVLKKITTDRSGFEETLRAQ